MAYEMCLSPLLPTFALDTAVISYLYIYIFFSIYKQTSIYVGRGGGTHV